MNILEIKDEMLSVFFTTNLYIPFSEAAPKLLCSYWLTFKLSVP